MAVRPKRRAPLYERLDFYTDKTGGPDACWPWKAMRDPLGYGKLNARGMGTMAHRLTWMVHNGEIPVGMIVCHRCDNPPCCNPAHLFLGTNADNMADKVAKGRQSRLPGEKSGTAKLTWEKVREIRAAAGPYKPIAMFYGISETNVCMIKNGHTWRESN